MAISQPTIQNRNGEITGYTIRFIQESNGVVKIYTTLQVGQPFTATTLLPYTSYSYTVAAQTINGTGPFSRSSMVVTAETGTEKSVTVFNIVIAT